MKERGWIRTMSRILAIQGRAQTVFFLLPMRSCGSGCDHKILHFLVLSDVAGTRTTTNTAAEPHSRQDTFQKVSIGVELLLGRRSELCACGGGSAAVSSVAVNTGSVTLTFRPVKPLKIENTYLFERLRATENEYLFALRRRLPASRSGKAFSIITLCAASGTGNLLRSFRCA